MGKWSVVGWLVVRGFDKTLEKKRFGVVILSVHFARGLFCYSNFNFFNVDDKEETNLIARSNHSNL